MGLLREIRNRVRRHKFERTDEGIFLPDSKLSIGGVFDFNVNGGPLSYAPNRIVNQGLNHILNVIFGSATKISTWYVAPYANPTNPLATWEASNFASSAGEFDNYTEGTRRTWTPGAVSSFTISNNASRAFFTIGDEAAEDTIQGAGLLSVNTKGATTGVLIAAARLATPRTNLQEDDEVGIGYSVIIADAS